MQLIEQGPEDLGSKFASQIKVKLRVSLLATGKKSMNHISNTVRSTLTDRYHFENTNDIADWTNGWFK